MCTGTLCVCVCLSGGGSAAGYSLPCPHNSSHDATTPPLPFTTGIQALGGRAEVTLATICTRLRLVTS